MGEILTMAKMGQRSSAMRNKITLVLAAFFFFTAAIADSNPVPGALLTESQKIADLHWLFTIFDANYAPLAYKQKIHSFEYEKLKKKFLREARESKTNEEFFAIEQAFVAQFRDAHTSLTLTPSEFPGRSRIAFAGFLVKRIGDAFVVREILPFVDPVLLPVKVGDVILEVNGKPVNAFIDKYITPYRNLGNPEANYSLLANMVFMRDGLKMPVPTEKTVRLKVKSAIPEGAYSPSTKEVEIPWAVRDYADFKREMIPGSKAEKSLSNGRQVIRLTEQKTGKSFTMAYLDPSGNILSAEKALYQDGGTGERAYEQFQFKGQSDVTFDSTEIQKKLSNTPLERLRDQRIIPKFANFVDDAHFFPAFVYPSEVLNANGKPSGKKIFRGYVRVDTFSPNAVSIPKPNGKGSVVVKPTLAVIKAELRQTLATFERFGVTEVTIDTLGNPGGSLELLLAVAQAFSNKPIDPLTMTVRLNEHWLNDIEWGARNAPSPAREIYQEALDSMRESLANGETMSKPFRMDVIAPFTLDPNTDLKRKFKKLSILVDEGNASCGDIFPAIIQDNNLGTIIGVNTMGAGGNVVTYDEAPNSHAKLRQTESLVIRKDGSILENKGVKPDVDFNFRLNLRTAIQDAIVVMETRVPGSVRTVTEFRMPLRSPSSCIPLLKK